MGRKHASGSAQQREQNGFGEHLSDEPNARCAKRGTNCHFLLARSRASEEHVGHIHTRKQQNHPRKPNEQDRDQTQYAAFGNTGGGGKNLDHQSLLVFGILAGEPFLD
jgi:hypothetical protein